MGRQGMSNRCRIDAKSNSEEGRAEADSRAGSGRPVPKKTLTRFGPCGSTARTETTAEREIWVGTAYDWTKKSLDDDNIFNVWPLWCACSFSGCEWAYCHGTLLCEFSKPNCGGVLGGNDQNRTENPKCCTHLVPTRDLVVRSSWSPSM